MDNCIPDEITPGQREEKGLEKGWMNQWSNGMMLSVKHGGGTITTLAARRTGSLVFPDLVNSQPNAVLHCRWMMTHNPLVKDCLGT